MAAVIEPRIVGAGRQEDEWRRSAWLAALPACSSIDVLGAHRRLVVLSPHPDDETLACGGLMRAASAAGLPILLVSVTDGEGCYPGDSAWTPALLRAQRPREVRNALCVLGVETTLYRIGLPDGAVARHAAVLVRDVAALLQPHDLVLAPWAHDGHPDHDAVGLAAQHATRVIGASVLHYPVWAWHWLDPDAGQPPFNAFKLMLAAPDTDAKTRAIACFASQLGTAGIPAPQPVLPAHVIERFLRPFEVYLP